MIKKWDVVSREEVFHKYSRKIEKVIFKLPDGSEDEFYIKDEGKVVVVLALTPENQVIVVRQFRPGPLKILHDMPGGVNDSGEEPIESMQRELLEEAGYEGELQFVATCLDDAYSTLRRYCYVATNCKKVRDPDNSRPTEQTEVVLLPLADFRTLLKSGQMTDVEAGYLCLDFLGLL